MTAAVISAPLGSSRVKFELAARREGVRAASSAIIGCIFGRPFAGYMSDRFGRKKILILPRFYLAFRVSARRCQQPHNRALARFVGIGWSAASMLSPLYITELAPAKVQAG